METKQVMSMPKGELGTDVKTATVVLNACVDTCEVLRAGYPCPSSCAVKREYWKPLAEKYGIGV